jgi:hypothetical protein
MLYPYAAAWRTLTMGLRSDAWNDGKKYSASAAELDCPN